MIDFCVEHDQIKPGIIGYEEWLQEVAVTHNCDIREITYILTTDTRLLDLNQTFLKRDYYTDVLAFDRSAGGKLAGDVFISLDRIYENAQEYNVEFDLELRRVMVHGLLHMIGYGDGDKKSREAMSSAEDRALDLFHVKQ